MGLFYGTGSLSEFFGNPASWWDHFKNGTTNDVNLAVANQNLDYQKERARIEDNRYAEETEYNRAFAEDERAYNRALQQQLFNREDTAIERQASQLSAMGINPLSQQMNGLGAGQAISSSLPSSSAIPSSSSRSASPLHNDFQMQDVGILQALSPLATLANTINQLKTAQGQRDLLQTQIEKQTLDNFIRAKENGVLPYNFKGFNYLNGQDIGSGLFDRENVTRTLDNNMKSLDYKYKYMPDFAKNLNYLVSDDFFTTAEKALTKGSQLYEKSFDKLFDKNNSQSMYDLGKDSKGKFNPFQMFMNLFF